MSKPKAVVVDVDGTLCLMDGGRGPYEYDKCGQDKANPAVVELVQVLEKAGYAIVLASGREDTCRRETVDWMLAHGVPFSELFMRAAKDYRDDREVKAEIYHEHIEEHYAVAFVLDDRDKVVTMWRELGLTCLQVAPGDF